MKNMMRQVSTIQHQKHFQISLKEGEKYPLQLITSWNIYSAAVDFRAGRPAKQSTIDHKCYKTQGSSWTQEHWM